MAPIITPEQESTFYGLMFSIHTGVKCVSCVVCMDIEITEEKRPEAAVAAAGERGYVQLEDRWCCSACASDALIAHEDLHRVAV